MSEIIQDTKKLNQLITTTIRQGKTYRDNMHLAFISSLWHAAKHGQCAPLNRLFASFTSNDQTAARNFLRRVHAALGGLDFSSYIVDGEQEVIPAEVMNAAVEAGSWLAYNAKNKNFAVKKDTVDVREAFETLADGSLIEPDGEVWKRFFDRNNLAELKAFGDAQFLKDMEAVEKKLAGDNARVDSQVSNKLAEMFGKFVDQARTYVNTNAASVAAATETPVKEGAQAA